MTTLNYDTFFQLVRLGIGTSKDAEIPKEVDWIQLKALADMQGLSAVVLDGIDVLGSQSSKSQENPTQNLSDSQLSTLNPQLKLEWIGEVLQGEQTYKLHQEVATDMANLFHRNGIRTYVLKGRIVAGCYPKPEHRVSSDMDCFLVEEASSKFQASGSKGFDAWKLGNDLIRAKKFEVRDGFYKNSSFELPGLTVENHQFLTPFRGNERLASLEKVLQALLRADKGEDIIEGTWLYRPPTMVSALFLIEHAYSHFLHEGLTWRMVLDWVLFKKKHKAEIDWSSFEAYIEEFGFQLFYNSFSRLGALLMGEIHETDLTKSEKKMLADVWAPLDLHETLHGVKGKLALAGNTWRARWKYRYFTDMNWIKALWIQVKGFLFIKHPKLN